MGNQCFKEHNDDINIENLPKSASSSNQKQFTESYSNAISNSKTGQDIKDEYYQFQKLNSLNTTSIGFVTGYNKSSGDFSYEPQFQALQKVNISDFNLLKVLGKGSFGKVLLVSHKLKKKEYAMKILLKSQIQNDRQKRHTMTERFILESAVHPFLVKLHYAFQNEYKLYLVVDYINGGELFYHLRKNIKFTEDLAKHYAAEILLAIEYLHQNGIIYRDLKPENVLLDSEGHIKLTDFGLSKMCVANERYTYSLCGTPEYIAPEILTQYGYDKQCDWWSFGALLYEMLVGAPPFYSDNKKEMLRKIINLPVPIPQSLSEEAKSLLSRLLVVDPQKRIGQIGDALEIKKHSFFRTVNFDDIYNKKIKPPYKFDNDPTKFKFFDQKMIRQIPNDSPVKSVVQKYEMFSNFTYQKMDMILSEDQGKQVNAQSNTNNPSILVEFSMNFGMAETHIAPPSDNSGLGFYQQDQQINH